MKIESSRTLFTEQTERRRLAFIELLTERKRFVFMFILSYKRLCLSVSHVMWCNLITVQWYCFKYLNLPASDLWANCNPTLTSLETGSKNSQHLDTHNLREFQRSLSGEYNGHVLQKTKSSNCNIFLTRGRRKSKNISTYLNWKRPSSLKRTILMNLSDLLTSYLAMVLGSFQILVNKQLGFPGVWASRVQVQINPH